MRYPEPVEVARVLAENPAGIMCREIIAAMCPNATEYEQARLYDWTRHQLNILARDGKAWRVPKARGLMTLWGPA